VAAAFARGSTSVIGFDIDAARIAELKAGEDRTREVEAQDLRLPSLSLTSDPEDLGGSDFFVVTVPTPIDGRAGPTWVPARSLAHRRRALKKGDIVVYESTVYPGAVEEECLPILEGESGLKAGGDFNVGYSRERINPGDRKHRFESITKVVSAQNPQTLDIVRRHLPVGGQGRHSSCADDPGGRGG